MKLLFTGKHWKMKKKKKRLFVGTLCRKVQYSFTVHEFRIDPNRTDFYPKFLLQSALVCTAVHWNDGKQISHSACIVNEWFT